MHGQQNFKIYFDMFRNFNILDRLTLNRTEMFSFLRWLHSAAYFDAMVLYTSSTA